MATCGYVCPLCEGRGVDEHGIECQWCKPFTDTHTNTKTNEPQMPVSDEEWIKSVHEGKCCGDE